MSDSAFESKPFRLSLVQLGGTGDDKVANLAHAKEMVSKAAQPVDGKKTDLIMLPVSICTILRVIGYLCILA
jgi:omega-amidase